jgi:hypothetical protein
LKQAREVARELKPLAPAEAALKEGDVWEQDADLLGEEPRKRKSQLDAYSEGLAGKRSVEGPTKYTLYLKRAALYEGGRLPSGQDLDAAAADATQAFEVAKEVQLDRAAQATAVGAAGLYRNRKFLFLKSDPQKAKPYLQGFVEDLRQALALDPDRPAATDWRIKIVAAHALRLLSKDAADAAAAVMYKQLENARVFEESSRLLREAWPNMSPAQHSGFKEFREALDRDALTELRAAALAAPRDPDVWLWQWGIVELLRAGGGKDTAKEQAERIVDARKKMPDTAPRLYRERVEQLEKEVSK